MGADSGSRVSSVGMAIEATAGSDFFSTTKDLSLSEVASICGYSVRNLRSYMQLGVLHHGDRRGRETRYDETHLARLDLVRVYRKRGYSLAAIADLIADDSLQPPINKPTANDIINSWFQPTATFDTIAALEAAFPQISSHPNLVVGAIDRDLASLRGTELTVHCPAALEFGLDLLRHGVALEATLDEIDRLGELVKPIVTHALRVESLMAQSDGIVDDPEDAEIVPLYILRIASMSTRRLERERVIDLTS